MSPYHWNESLTKDKNMFLSGAQVLVNPVNCVGVMGKGLAKQFRDTYPFLYDQYKADCKSGKLKPGYTLLYHCASDNRWVANIATENHYKDGAREEWIVQGIRNLRDAMYRSQGHYRKEYLQSVAIPRIGCGLGGLDWNKIKPLIIHELKGCNFDVWLDGEIFLRNEKGVNLMTHTKTIEHDSAFIWNKQIQPNKDIFNSNAQVIINPVNCVGAMGKGLALAFKKKFPSINVAYQRDCALGIYKPGSCHLYYAGNGLWVANIASKDHWKNPSKKEWVVEGIKNLVKELHARESFSANGNHFHSIAVPRIGCGLGGLNWREIRSLVIRELQGQPYDVWLDGQVYCVSKTGPQKGTNEFINSFSHQNIPQDTPALQKKDEAWRNLPMTDKQKEIIRKNQLNPNWTHDFKGTTRGEAFDYINKNISQNRKLQAELNAVINESTYDSRRDW